MPLNTQNARIVDPVLTNHVRGYKNPDVQRIGGVLFPRAPIAKRGAKIVRFGKEAFRRHPTERAPGDRIRRVRVGYTSDSVNLFQHALAGEVPRELLREAEGVPSVNLQMRAMNLPAEIIEREKEIKAAQIASTWSNYGASNRSKLDGVSRWNAGSAAIGADVDAAQDVIRSKTGRRANVLAVGPQVARRLYEINRVRVVADAAYAPVPLEPRLNPLTGTELDMSLCVLRSVSPIHALYMRNMGVAASLVCSIVVGGRLWGLLACHHDTPRRVPVAVRAACDLLSEALATRI